MDPLTIVATIGSVCQMGGKLIYQLSRYIDQVRSVPKEIQALSVELGAVYSTLGHVKLIIENPEQQQTTKFMQWAADFETILANCQETFDQIRISLDKAKVKTQSSANGQLIKCIKWNWKQDDIKLLCDRLGAYKASVMLMLQALNSHKQDEIERAIKQTREIVQQLQKDREKIKESFAIIEKDHSRYTSPDLVLLDRRAENMTLQEHMVPQEPSPSSRLSLTDIYTSKWPISSIRFWDQDNDKNKSGQWQDPKLSVQLCRGKCARIELSLGDLRETLRLEAEKYEDVSQSEPLSYRLGYSIGRSIFGSNDAPKKPAPSNARYKAWYPKYIQSQNRGCCYYHASFCAISTPSPSQVLLGPSSLTNPKWQSQGFLELTFPRSRDATDFAKALALVVDEVKRAWQAHCVAFKNLEPHVDVGNPLSLLHAAAQTDARWQERQEGCVVM